MIEGAIGQIPRREILQAMPNMLRAARGEGVQLFQIEAAFANGPLQRFVFKQAGELGGTTSTLAGRDTINFILGWAK